MRIKNDAHLTALLAASAARARGERVAATGEGWKRISLPKHNGGEGALSPVREKRDVSRLQMRILGMDTALRKTGWGIIEICGKKISAVDCGVIINPPSAKVTDCMRHLNGAIKGLIEKYHPDEATIEGGFYCKNARTAIILGTARGAVLGVLAEAELPVYEYAPRRAKQSVTGNGNATKEQVAAMVANILRIDVKNLADDSTDALALALCHAAALTNAAVLPEEPI